MLMKCSISVTLREKGIGWFSFLNINCINKRDSLNYNWRKNDVLNNSVTAAVEETESCKCTDELEVVMHYTLHYTTPHTPHSTLHYTHYTTAHNTTLHHTTLQHTTLHYTTIHYSTLHYTTAHHTTLHYNTLQHTTLQHTYTDERQKLVRISC